MAVHMERCEKCNTWIAGASKKDFKLQMKRHEGWHGKND